MYTTLTNNSALGLRSVSQLWARTHPWLKNGALLLLLGFSHVISIHIESGQHVLSCSQISSLRPVDVAIAKDRSGCLGMKLGIANYGPAFGLLLHASLSLLLAV